MLFQNCEFTLVGGVLSEEIIDAQIIEDHIWLPVIEREVASCERVLIGQ